MDVSNETQGRHREEGSGRRPTKRSCWPCVAPASRYGRHWDAGTMESCGSPPRHPAVVGVQRRSTGRLSSIPGILASVTYTAPGAPLVQTDANGSTTRKIYPASRFWLKTIGTNASSLATATLSEVALKQPAAASTVTATGTTSAKYAVEIAVDSAPLAAAIEVDFASASLGQSTKDYVSGKCR